MRAGRLWLLVVNYVAVLGFLDLLRITVSPVAVIAARPVDFIVLYVLFTNRPWFQRPTADEPPEPLEPPRLSGAGHPLTPPTARPPTM